MAATTLRRQDRRGRKAPGTDGTATAVLRAGPDRPELGISGGLGPVAHPGRGTADRRGTRHGSQSHPGATGIGIHRQDQFSPVPVALAALVLCPHHGDRRAFSGGTRCGRPAQCTAGGGELPVAGKAAALSPLPTRSPVTAGRHVAAGGCGPGGDPAGRAARAHRDLQ